MATATEQIYAAHIDRYRDHLALLRAQVVKDQYFPSHYKEWLTKSLDIVDSDLNYIAHTLRQ